MFVPLKPPFRDCLFGSWLISVRYQSIFAPYKQQRHTTPSSWLIFSLVSIKFLHHTYSNIRHYKIKTLFTWFQNLNISLAWYDLHVLEFVETNATDLLVLDRDFTQNHIKELHPELTIFSVWGNYTKKYIAFYNYKYFAS